MKPLNLYRVNFKTPFGTNSKVVAGVTPFDAGKTIKSIYGQTSHILKVIKQS